MAPIADRLLDLPQSLGREPLGRGKADQLMIDATAWDAAVRSVTASLLAAAVATLRAEIGPVSSAAGDAARAGGADGRERPDPVVPRSDRPTDRPDSHVRHFEVDGSTFLDGAYLIKGVAGRILAALLRQSEAEGRTRFTTRELRLDPTLGLPGHRDNLDSRLLLLRRRLDAHGAPIRIERTGRGRIRLALATRVRLELVTADQAG